MKLVVARLILFSVLLAAPALSAPLAFAQDHGGEAQKDESSGPGGIGFLGGPSWDDAKDTAIWAIVGVATFGTVLGVLYLFKRKVGGFPEHPTWVAPISIMLASDLPSEDMAAHDGETSHGAHAPAH